MIPDQPLRDAAIQIALALRCDELASHPADVQADVVAGLADWAGDEVPMRLSIDFIPRSKTPSPAERVSRLLSDTLLALDQLLGSKRTVPHRIDQVLGGEPYPLDWPPRQIHTVDYPLHPSGRHLIVWTDPDYEVPWVQRVLVDPMDLERVLDAVHREMGRRPSRTLEQICRDLQVEFSSSEG